MKKITYLESLMKIDEKISTNDLYKQLYIEIIKYSIEKNDYMGLVQKTTSMFEIDHSDAQLLLVDISTDDNLEETWPVIGTELQTYLRLIAITYAESIYDIRHYASVENKMLLAESYLSNYDTKLAIDLKRVDGESFYFDMNFDTMIIFTSQIINTFSSNVQKNKDLQNNMHFLESAIQLRGAATLLAHAFERNKDVESGVDLHDGTIE